VLRKKYNDFLQNTDNKRKYSNIFFKIKIGFPLVGLNARKIDQLSTALIIFVNLRGYIKHKNVWIFADDWKEEHYLYNIIT